jgi:gas vesicle protein
MFSGGDTVNYMDFAKGVGIGMVTGAAVSIAMMPKKKNARTTAGKLVKTAGRILSAVQETFNM